MSKWYTLGAMFSGEAGISRRDGSSRRIEIPPLPDVPTSTVRRGEIIYNSGWPATDLVVLRRGRVINHRYRPKPEGRRWGEREIVAEMFTAPSVLGYEVLDGSNQYRATAEAFDTCTLQYLDRGELASLAWKKLAFVQQLLVITRALIRRREDFIEARSKGLAAAVAFTLLDLAKATGLKINRVPQRVIYMISGFTREKVNSVMVQFRRGGYISYKEHSRDIYLLQPGNLRSVAETGSFPVANKSTGDIPPTT